MTLDSFDCILKCKMQLCRQKTQFARNPMIGRYCISMSTESFSIPPEVNTILACTATLFSVHPPVGSGIVVPQEPLVEVPPTELTAPGIMPSSSSLNTSKVNPSVPSGASPSQPIFASYSGSVGSGNSPGCGSSMVHSPSGGASGGGAPWDNAMDRTEKTIRHGNEVLFIIFSSL